jgi:flavin reductase (DIM6/NTAB) family NADH-FMN oxidoreductase RutF
MSDDVDVVSGDDYRAVMRQWPSGVTVITMLDGEMPHGMTASAFTSVSVSPPLVLIVVDKRWRSHVHLSRGGVFCVNILAEDQSAVSDRFAGRHGDVRDRFHDVPARIEATGAPVLAEALAWLDCRVEQMLDAGDHTIFLGKVVAAGVNRPAAQPLIFHNTQYRALAGADD